MTSVEAHFSGDRVRLYVNGHRLRLLWALSGTIWTAILADYVWSQRKGLR